MKPWYTLWRMSISRVIRRQRLSDLYGSLRSQRPFPGKDAVRVEVGRALGLVQRTGNS
jgi:hypothetical protein